MATKNCRVCGNEFFAVRSSVTCSKECSDSNKRNRNKDSLKRGNINFRLKCDEYSKEIGLPSHYVRTYGIKFLKDNPSVVETLKISHLLIGKKNIPDYVVELRRSARKTPSECNREKFVPKVRQCKICNSDYTGRGSQKTCSDKCSSELNKRTIELNRERNKGKVYKRDKEKQKINYEKRWSEISRLAKERGITTREAKKLLSNKNK